MGDHPLEDRSPAVATLPRRFQLRRLVDVSGVSGTGIVAYGVEFHDGTVAYRWLSAVATTNVAPNVSVVLAIHGHQGNTELEWLD